MRFLMIFVGISGAFSVLFGAWLAHAGAALPEVEQIRLNKALQYQFIHTLALFVSLVWLSIHKSNWAIAASLSFVVGIVFFSGSLYLRTFFDMAAVGKLAPIGGSLLALGWLFIAFSAVNENFRSNIYNKHKR